MTVTVQTIETSDVTCTLDRVALTAAVAKVCLAIEKRVSIPILTTIWLQGAGDGLLMTGTDLDLQIEVFVPGDVPPDLCVCVEAHKLLKLLKTARKSDTVTLSDDQESDHLCLDFSGLEVALNTMPPGDFPSWIGNNNDLIYTGVSLPSGELAKAIRRTAFAISTEETRYYLNGIYVEPYQGKLRFVATDGHRLGLCDITDGADDGDWLIDCPVKGIVPHRTVKALQAILKTKDCGDSVKVDGTRRLPSDLDSHCSWLNFTIGDVCVRTKTIDGAFPDYHRVIPLGNNTLWRAAAVDMEMGLKDISVISDSPNRAARFDIGKTETRLTLFAPDSGTASAVVPGVGLLDKDKPLEVHSSVDPILSIGLNMKYVRDILAQFDKADVVEFAFGNESGPVVMRKTDDDSFLFVQMPMRI